MIREYRPTDTEAMLAVWARASAVAHPFLSPEFLEAERRNIPEVYVGFLSLLGNEVGAVFVDPDLHRSGIGRALMDRARLAGGARGRGVREEPVGQGVLRGFEVSRMTRSAHPTLVAAGSVAVLIMVAPGACDATSEPPLYDPSVVVAEVEGAVWRFHAADTSRSADGVIALLWPEYEMLVDGRRQTYEEVVRGSREFLGDLALFHTDWTDLRVTPIGPDAAVASFQFSDSILTRSGELIRSRGPTTFLWVRRGDEWRLLYGDADHYSIE